MIKNTIDLLSMGEYYGVTKRIDVAKGLKIGRAHV